MNSFKNKVKLSPQLQLGVGRNSSSGNLWKYSGFIFLVISLVLGIRTLNLVIHGPESLENQGQPQVLGANDNSNGNQNLFIEYKVKKGDTIYAIGQQYGVEWTTLATLNGLQPPFELKIGQVVKIPAK